MAEKNKYPNNLTFVPKKVFDSKTHNNNLKGNFYCFEDELTYLKPKPEYLAINKKGKKVNSLIDFGEIYVLCAVGTTLFKIGSSTNFERRFRDISAASPIPLVVYKYGKCDNPNLLEDYLHDLFKDKYFKNEWFSLDESDLDKINTIFNQYYDAN